jgi:hypothetical protein
MQQMEEHSAAVLCLPECHAKPDERIDDFPIAGLPPSYRAEEGERVGKLRGAI